MRFVENSAKGPLLIRADSEGSVIVWCVPQVSNSQLSQIRQQPTSTPSGHFSFITLIIIILRVKEKKILFCFLVNKTVVLLLDY